MFGKGLKIPVRGWLFWLLVLQLGLTACGGANTEAPPAATLLPTTAVATPVPTQAPSTSAAQTQPVLPTVTPFPTAVSAPSPTRAPLPATAPAQATALAPTTVLAVNIPPITQPAPTAGVVAVIPARQASDEASFIYLKYPAPNDLTYDLMQNSLNGSPGKTIAKKVLSALKVASNRVVILQEVTQGNETVVQLKMFDLSGAADQSVLLDPLVFKVLPKEQQTSSANGRYGVETRVIDGLAVTSDGNQLAYPKANLSASFENLQGTATPTELWTVNLKEANPVPARLVPNNQDFIARPLWSIDNNRLAFIRVTSFGTGAGYPTALWSVYKDGSRLAHLTGPALGKFNGQDYQAYPAFNQRWLSPTVLAFQASNAGKSTQLWQHDLSLGLESPRPLSLVADYQTFFCDQPRRFVYQVRNSDGSSSGILSVQADLPSTKEAAQPAPAPIDPAATELLGCRGDKVIYQGADNKLVLVSLKSDGTFTRQGFNYSEDSANRPLLNFSPDGRYFSLLSSKKSTLDVFNSEGGSVASSGVLPSTGSVGWRNKRFLGINTGGNQPGQLLVFDTDTPAGGFKQIDATNGFRPVAEDKSY